MIVITEENQSRGSRMANRETEKSKKGAVQCEILLQVSSILCSVHSAATSK